MRMWVTVCMAKIACKNLKSNVCACARICVWVSEFSGAGECANERRSFAWRREFIIMCVFERLIQRFIFNNLNLTCNAGFFMIFFLEWWAGKTMMISRWYKRIKCIIQKLLSFAFALRFDINLHRKLNSRCGNEGCVCVWKRRVRVCVHVSTIVDFCYGCFYTVQQYFGDGHRAEIYEQTLWSCFGAWMVCSLAKIGIVSAVWLKKKNKNKFFNSSA